MPNFTKLTFLCTTLLLLVALIYGKRAPSYGGGFVQTRGTEFFVDGCPFLFNGFNSYWMMSVATEPSERSKVVRVFRDAAAAGMSVCRTSAFNDGAYQALQKSPGVYDEKVFQGLDFVIAEARRHGIRLILIFCNNYADYGGRPQYVNWTRAAGENITNDDEFYTNEVAKSFYKNHVKKVITRINTITKIAYKDDPTIMAWELMNEPRCDSDPSGKTLTRWIQEMAPYVKSIDNKHLLDNGMEGFYGDSVPERKQFNPGYEAGTDFITSNNIKEIDFTSIHAYPSGWLPAGKNDSQSQIIFLERWITSHWADSRRLRKPLVFGEFGKSSKESGFTMRGRDWYLNMNYWGIYNLARRGGTIVGGLVWQVMAEGMDTYFDGYEIVLSKDYSTWNVICEQSRRMAALARSRTHWRSHQLKDESSYMNNSLLHKSGG